MQTAAAKLLTIVAESVLEERLTRLVLAEGASGYTLQSCSGQGSRGLRSTTPVDGQNIRIEVVASDGVAGRVLARLAADYFTNYAVVAWVTPVEFARGEKFGAVVS